MEEKREEQEIDDAPIAFGDALLATRDRRHGGCSTYPSPKNSPGALSPTMPFMDIRKPEASEIDHLAQLWYDGWQDAHAQVVPAELKRLRTLQNFRERMRDALPHTRVIGPPGGALGFCTIKADELYQLYVASIARGTNVAAELIDDGEARLRGFGVKTAWLSVAIGNERAIRFYEKQGWRRIGKMTNLLDTIEGEFELVTWRFEKDLQ